MVVERHIRLGAGMCLLLASCGPRWIEDDAPTTGSNVVYEPANGTSPDGPPARLPTSPAFVEPRQHAVELRDGASSVRYEPILDDAPTEHTSREAPIDDELPDEHDDGEGHPLTWPPRTSGKALHGPVDPAIFGVHLTPDGLALPYPTAHMFRGFGRCRGKRHHHEAIDLGGVGPDWGVGTPIRSMARAEVIFIGSGEDDPDDFGTPDKRSGSVLRGDRKLPRYKDIEPYGRVYFFTRKKGRWRSGNVIVTRVVDGAGGPLEGHSIRYLHVAAIYPDLAVGTIVERGQEIALMGGTGVQESAPHLHLDIQAPDGRRIDVAPLLGLPPTATCEAPRDPDPPMPEPVRATATRPEREGPTFELRNVAISRCKATTRHEDFSSGRYASHTMTVPLAKGQKLSIEVSRRAGRWKPRLEIEGDDVALRALATGKIGSKARTSVTAKRDTSITVTVGGWDGPPPSDATYALGFRERCRGR